MDFTRLNKPFFLKSKPRIVVSGATGWLGRSLVTLLVKNYGVKNSELLLMASKDTQIHIDKAVFPVYAMKIDSIEKFAPSVFFHLACVTKDNLKKISKDVFLEKNHRILEFATEVISLESIENVMITSSGAAVRFAKEQGSRDFDPYGFFKNFEENHFQKLVGSNLLTIRPWSLTGGLINKYSEYALSDMILQAEQTNSIVVRASNMVLRRYASADQFLQVALQLMGTENQLVLDSGGPLTDLVQLAHVVSRALDTNSRVLFNIDEELPYDDYFSKSYLYESLIQEMNMIPQTIEQQVIETIRGMKARRGSF